MIWKIVPLSPPNLHHKSIITSLRVIVYLPIIQRTNVGTKKSVQNRRTRNSPEKELNKIDEMKATKISEAKFKRMIIRMLKNLRGRMADVSQNLSKDI